MASKTKLGVAMATVAVGIVCSGASASPALAAVNCSTDSPIRGAGSSFQNNAQVQWTSSYNGGGSPFCSPAPPASTIQPYQPVGSGTGTAWFSGRAPAQGTGSTDKPAAFAGTDNAPNGDTTGSVANSVTAIQNGTAASTDNGVLETIPVAAAAVTTIVNLPAGCTPGSTDAQGRALITNANVQAAWAGSITNWGQLVNNTGNASCTGAPIKRVVRRDSSGTSYEYKGWLYTQNTGNLATSVSPPTWQGLQSANTTWPQPSGATPVTVPSADGGSALASTVTSTDGSIGYLALPDARANGFTKLGSTDDTYWIRMEDGTSTATTRSYAEPSTNGVASTTKAASNCASVTYKDRNTGALPTTTQSNGAWSRVEGFNTPTAGVYPICSLTYDLAWDNAQTATSSGTAPFTAAQACTVRHFLGYAVSTGQTALTSLDYAALPTSVRTLAQAGQGRIQNSTSSCS